MHDRIARLAATLAEEGVDAFFASDPITMGYLHDFHEGGHERFLTLGISASGQCELICPALSANQAERVGVRNIRSWRDGEDPLALFQDLADRWSLKTGILAVDDDMPARMLLQMQDALPAALFKPGQSLIGRLMRRKSEEEIALLKEAGRIADETFQTVHPQIRAGMSEVQVQEMLESEMRRRGGQPEFCIVATGPGSAEPHHKNDETVLKEGDVLILDFGCRRKNYISDITRTVAVGHASDKAREVYQVVLAAHRAGRAAVRTGATPESVDAAARKVIDDAGYGKFFVHRTGHGVGMRVHEEPYIVAGNLEPLEAGECFSVEPGIYLPGEFGIRIENLVACGADGELSLNSEPPDDLIVVG
jgi:Xaa-Pro aminopeptidase